MKLQQATLRHLSFETLLVSFDLHSADCDIRVGECLGTRRRKRGRNVWIAEEKQAHRERWMEFQLLLDLQWSTSQIVKSLWLFSRLELVQGASEGIYGDFYDLSNTVWHRK